MSAQVKTVTPLREVHQYGGSGVITLIINDCEPVEGSTRDPARARPRIYLWFWDSSWLEPAYATVLDALEARATEMAARGNG